MGFKCGIVGLPNVGKSTLFNALTATQAAESANYPFCTIEPNVGIVSVPDPRLDTLAQIVNPQKIIGAQMEFLDIAGLVAGASKGEGLGNQFLANIREVDAIAHVVRCFEDDDITHVAGKVDPLADIDTIETELALADLASVEKRKQNIEKLAKSGNAEARAELDLLGRYISVLNDGKAARTVELSEADEPFAKQLRLLTAKPMLYVCNVNEEDAAEGNAHSAVVAKFAAEQGAEHVIITAAIEQEIAQLEEDEKAEFLETIGLSEPGLNRLIRAGYALLNLQTYFTAGVKEVRAWTFPQGATAPQAAGKIHGDFEKGFIRAETTAFDDYVTCQGENGAREAGKLRQEGKTYIVQDGDVMNFKFNV